MSERQLKYFDRISSFFPLFIAIFAAVLSICDLQFGKYAFKMDIYRASRDRTYQWYQAKGIKNTQIEGQMQFFNALIDAGIIEPDKSETVKNLTNDLTREIERYEKERREILLGSKVVGEANWVQEVNGEKGKIVGAKEYEDMVETYGGIVVHFSYAAMLLRICLALGAVGVILNKAGTKILFMGLTVLTGGLGTIYFILAFIAQQAMP